MRIRLDLHGVTFEYERHPLPAGRFRALCVLAATGMYVGMVTAIAALCGLPGVVAMLIGTAVGLLLCKGFE